MTSKAKAMIITAAGVALVITISILAVTVSELFIAVPFYVALFGAAGIVLARVVLLVYSSLAKMFEEKRLKKKENVESHTEIKSMGWW